MNNFSQLSDSLKTNQAGHWGLITPHGFDQLESVLLEELMSNRRILCFHFRCHRYTRIEDSVTNALIECDTAYDFIRNTIAINAHDGRDTYRFIVTSFDLLSVHAQCEFLRASRAIRDESSSLKLQFVLSGSWNLFSLQSYWKKCFSEVSPAPDQKHVFFPSYPDLKTVIFKIQSTSIASSPLNRFDYLCAEYIFEVTGGDILLIDYTINRLISLNHGMASVEEVVSSIGESAILIDEIKQRTIDFSEEAWLLLNRLLNNQVVVCDYHDAVAEELSLAGLVKSRRSGTKLYLSVRSFAINSLLRFGWKKITPNSSPVFPIEELVPGVIAVNAAAFKLISDIENMLRNLILLKIGSKDDWIDLLSKVKSGSSSRGDGIDDAQDLIKRFCILMGASFESIQSKLNEIAQSDDDTKDASPSTNQGQIGKAKKPTVLDDAISWRNRIKQNTVLELSSESLMHFFTTAGLRTVLTSNVSDVYAKYFKSVFPDTHELQSIMEQYRVLRDAIAHNQPISLGCYKRIEVIHDDIQSRIAKSA